jgi:hypothetical protein
MRARTRLAGVAAALAVALGGVAACGDDDGTDVRRVGETGGGSASGPASGSSASGSTVHGESGSTVEGGSGSTP